MGKDRSGLELTSSSVFPSSYRSDTVKESTDIKVDEQVNLSTSRVGREGHETRYASSSVSGSRQDRRPEEEVRVYEEERYRRPERREEKVHIHEEERFAPRDTTRVQFERDQRDQRDQ